LLAILRVIAPTAAQIASKLAPTKSPYQATKHPGAWTIDFARPSPAQCS
jgi:hypothetical protein